MAEAWVCTYDSLVTSVLQYLERQDPAVIAQLPIAIALAEYDIATKIKTLGQIQVAEFTFPTNDIIEKPARWRKTVSMNILVPGIGKQPVLLRKLEYVNNYTAGAGGASLGAPKFYADYDYGHWKVAPMPDQAYSAEVLFYQRVVPLSSSVQTNFLTANAPQAMLFGTLLQMQPFIKNDARIQTFAAIYADALGSLKQEDTLRTGDRQAVAVDS